MKNVCLSVFFFLLAIASIAQTTNVFPDSIAYWREGGIGGDIDGGVVWFNDYVMLGDTFVDGKKCKNLYLNRRNLKHYKGSQHLSQPYTVNDRFALSKKIAVLRKDSLKIFVRFEKNTKYIGQLAIHDSILKSGKEFLVFDFGWQKGDTIYSEHPEHWAPYLIVKNKYKIFDTQLSNDTLNVITFEGRSAQGWATNYIDSNMVVQGMGFTSQFFFRLTPFDTNYSVTRFSSGSNGVASFCADRKFFYSGKSFYSDVAGIDCQNVNMEISVGIDEVSKKWIKAYPNPANGIIELEGILDYDINSIVAIDVLGQVSQLTYRLKDSNITTNVASLPQGIYIILIETNKSTYLCRIIKQ